MIDSNAFQIQTVAALRERIRRSWIAHGRVYGSPGFNAVAVHALGQWRMSIRTRAIRVPISFLYRYLFRRCRRIHGIELPYTVALGDDVVFEHFGGVVIHGCAEIGDRCIIRQGVTLGNRYLDSPHDAPSVGRDVNIGAGAVILGAVRVGNGARIGANAIVLSDVPDGATAVGPKAIVAAKLLPNAVTLREADAS